MAESGILALRPDKGLCDDGLRLVFRAIQY
jgi:hypothetical protein